MRLKCQTLNPVNKYFSFHFNATITVPASDNLRLGPGLV